MGGVIGAMSPKFILHAGVLMVSARVEMHSVTAVLDPSVPMTTVSADVAKFVELPAQEAEQAPISRNRVFGLVRSEYRLRTVRVTGQPGAAPVTIGTDFIAKAPLLLDFRRNRFDVVEVSNRGLLQGDILAHVTRGMKAVPVTPSPGGCPSIAGEDATGRRIMMALVGTSTALDKGARTVQVRIGPAVLEGQVGSEVRSYCGADAIVHWESFGRQRIVIDFEHQTLWLG